MSNLMKSKLNMIWVLVVQRAYFYNPRMNDSVYAFKYELGSNPDNEALHPPYRDNTVSIEK